MVKIELKTWLNLDFGNILFVYPMDVKRNGLKLIRAILAEN